MILVTGGTGLVGAHLLYNLCKNNTKVVAIYRNQTTLNNTKEIFELYGNANNYKNIIWKKADICDLTELSIAFENITHVYHAAAMVSFASKDSALLHKINIEGTANIVNLCVSNNIKKLCYVSSIATLSKKPGTEYLDETCEWNPEENHSDYSISKYGGEMEVWRASQEGIPVVIVNPGVIFGFGVWNANTSKLFKQIQKGFPFYTKGATGVVGVVDVVTAMIALMNSDIKNERFILVAENKSYKDTFGSIAKQLNTKTPTLQVSKFVTEVLWRINSFVNLISFRTVDFGFYKFSSRAAHNTKKYNGEKIKKSIAFNYTPFHTVLQQIASKLS